MRESYQVSRTRLLASRGGCRWFGDNVIDADLAPEVEVVLAECLGIEVGCHTWLVCNVVDSYLVSKIKVVFAQRRGVGVEVHT